MHFENSIPQQNWLKRNLDKTLDNFSLAHLACIIICATLLLGDFLTTSIAVAAGSIQTAAGTVTFSEGNPLMALIVNSPLTFLASKIALLGLVVGAAYILRKNGILSFMPYVIIGGMYLLVVANNMSLLMAGL